MSPTRSPGQPSRARASLANFSRKSRSCGVPQLRLRDSRITCQSGPLIGSAIAPARHPFAYEPIARAARGAGPDAAPNNSFAGGSLAGSLAVRSFGVVFSFLAPAEPDGAATAFVCLWVGSAATELHTSISKK